jgi:hypothetical protein
MVYGIKQKINVEDLSFNHSSKQKQNKSIQPRIHKKHSFLKNLTSPLLLPGKQNQLQNSVMPFHPQLLVCLLTCWLLHLGIFVDVFAGPDQ